MSAPEEPSSVLAAASAFQDFRANLRREFPDESFLIVRFGDHQPYFARHLIDPSHDDSMLVRGVAAGEHPARQQQDVALLPACDLGGSPT